MGTRAIDDTALNDLARATVDAFLQIFGPQAGTEAEAGLHGRPLPAEE